MCALTSPTFPFSLLKVLKIVSIGESILNTLSRFIIMRTNIMFSFHSLNFDARLILTKMRTLNKHYILTKYPYIIINSNKGKPHYLKIPVSINKLSLDKHINFLWYLGVVIKR